MLKSVNKIAKCDSIKTCETDVQNGRAKQFDDKALKYFRV